MDTINARYIGLYKDITTNAVVFFFSEQQPYIDRVSGEILAAKLKAY